MAETKKLRFLRPRGHGAVRFATGVVADLAEPWASRFLNDGSAELVEQKPVKEPKPEPASKSAKKKK
jgi:hypothetical protein